MFGEGSLCYEVTGVGLCLIECELINFSLWMFKQGKVALIKFSMLPCLIVLFCTVFKELD